MDSKEQPKTGKKLPPNAGKGRPLGSPNKTTSELKAMILEALGQAGGVEYLLRQAKEKPVAFLALVGKVLPLQVTGDKDSPVVHRIELVAGVNRKD